VQFLDDGLGRDADGADEDFGAAFDDDVDELVEFAFRVVGLEELVVATDKRYRGRGCERSFSEHFLRPVGAGDRRRMLRSCQPKGPKPIVRIASIFLLLEDGVP